MLEFTDRVSRPVSMPTQDMATSKDERHKPSLHGGGAKRCSTRQDLVTCPLYSHPCAEGANDGVMVHVSGTLKRKGEAGAWAAMSRWTTKEKKGADCSASGLLSIGFIRLPGKDGLVEEDICGGGGTSAMCVVDIRVVVRRVR